MSQRPGDYCVHTVSLGVVALNEAEFLPGLLDDILAQDFDRKRLEVVLVDSGSVDATREIMEGFARRAEARDFFAVKVVDNPRRIQAAGWNEFIRHSSGDVLIRVDAHASIAPDFISRNVEVLEGGEDVCGGARPTAVPDALKTPWRSTLHVAEEAAFGSSVSPYRRDAGRREYVSSVFHGAYRRCVLESVGLFDERLLRTEDNDLHYRIRAAGYRICFDPTIRSAQYIRSSFRKMLKQKYGNGYWIGRTVYVQPRCFQAYHFAPLAFVLGAIALAIVGIAASWMPLIACAVLYAAACALLTVRAAVQSPERNWTMVALPLVFFGIHASYGIGTLVGLAAGLFKRMEPFDTRYAAGE